MITSMSALERQLADLLKRAEETKAKIADQKRRLTVEQCQVIDMLPKRLGVANLEAAMSLVRGRLRGEFGPLATSASGAAPAERKRKNRLSDEQKAKLDQMCQEKREDGKWAHTIEQIAASVSCATDTVNKRRAWLKKQAALAPA